MKSSVMHKGGLRVAEAPDPEMLERPSLIDDGTTIILKKPYDHDTPKTQPTIYPMPKVQSSALRQIDDIMVLCSKISENNQIKAAVVNLNKGAAAAGGGACLGGLLGGPPGIFIGGALGSAVGWWMTRGKFRPLYQIIIEMTPEEKEKLYAEVLAVLGNLEWDNLPELNVKVMCNSTLEKQIFDILIAFAKKQLKVKVKYLKK